MSNPVNLQNFVGIKGFHPIFFFLTILNNVSFQTLVYFIQYASWCLFS